MRFSNLANSATALSPTLGDAVSQSWSGPAQLHLVILRLLHRRLWASADGAHTISLTALDAAGNSSTDSLVFTWDTKTYC